MNNMSSQNRIRCISAIAMFLVIGVLIGAAAYWSFIPRGGRTILEAGMVAVSLAGWLALRWRLRCSGGGSCGDRTVCGAPC